MAFWRELPRWGAALNALTFSIGLFQSERRRGADRLGAFANALVAFAIFGALALGFVAAMQWVVTIQ